MSGEPPIDNCDPVTESNETLKQALAYLGIWDWDKVFTVGARPSDEHVKRLAVRALERINELERAVQPSGFPVAGAICPKCGHGPIQGYDDPDVRCPKCGSTLGVKRDDEPKPVT